ncbi:MAG TPA: SCO family protein [Baekduia sp.]|jgi:protein SCO1/2
MPVRARLALMVTATLVLLGALAIVVFADNAPTPTGPHLEGSIPPANATAANFALRDQDGKLVKLSDYRGRPLMLTFMYSTCRDTCPVTAYQMRGAMDDIGHDIPTLAISVDPKNDTPLNAKRFLNRTGLTGRMKFLMGTQKQLEPIWKAYGVQPQGKGFDHSAYVLVIDRRGVRRVTWPTEKLTPEGLAHDLRFLGV